MAAETNGINEQMRTIKVLIRDTVCWQTGGCELALAGLETNGVWDKEKNSVGRKRSCRPMLLFITIT